APPTRQLKSARTEGPLAFSVTSLREIELAFGSRNGVTTNQLVNGISAAVATQSDSNDSQDTIENLRSKLSQLRDIVEQAASATIGTGERAVLDGQARDLLAQIKAAGVGSNRTLSTAGDVNTTLDKLNLGLSSLNLSSAAAATTSLTSVTNASTTVEQYGLAQRAQANEELNVAREVVLQRQKIENADSLFNPNNSGTDIYNITQRLLQQKGFAGLDAVSGVKNIQLLNLLQQV
ncbi:MAG: hypothetical protein AB7U41_07310, partial [Dongiaceae bacterium]